MPPAAVATLGNRLWAFWERFRPCFRTRTRDASAHAYTYLRGQLTMDSARNFAHIARAVSGEDGQAVQHFMANSPWSAGAVFAQIQAEIAATPALAQGGVLILDDSADAKAGTDTAGASRQYNGRLGKGDVCRVDTCLGYANGGVWSRVDGELFLPKEWFGDAFAERREKLGIPPERGFETKLALGLGMSERVKLPFEWLACDAFYGRDSAFRAALDGRAVRYVAQVPATTAVYRRQPRLAVPARRSERGRPPSRCQRLSAERPQEVRALAARARWQRLTVRHSERGELRAEFALERVWTISAAHEIRREWLVVRRERGGRCTYTLSNAAADTPARTLIEASCQRYFVERLFEDAKTEIGWDEFQAQKYRAWAHHLALTAAAVWFIAQTKLAWRQDYHRDPALARQLEIEVLPALSTANVRELLKATLPLPRLTPAQATEQGVTHLVKRAHSTRSRLKHQQRQTQEKSHDSV